MAVKNNNIVGQKTECIQDISDKSQAEIRKEIEELLTKPNLELQERGEISALVYEVIPNLEPTFEDQTRYTIVCQPLGTHEGTQTLMEMCRATPAPWLVSEAQPMIGAEIKIRFDDIKNKNRATYMGPAGGLGSIYDLISIQDFLFATLGEVPSSITAAFGAVENFFTGEQGKVGSFNKLTEKQLNSKRKAVAYRNGKKTADIEVINLDGKLVEVNTAEMFLRMKEEAKKQGVNLTINSGYRSMEEQIRLYAKYRSGTGNLAAKPGYSNHQNGVALDISNSPKNVAWLRMNARRFGFYETVKTENWHWEFKGA